jgi:hypothetical protein
MGKYVLIDAYIAINGTVISDHAQDITIADTANKVDFTAFGGNGYSAFGQGLKDASVTANVFSDFAPGAINSIMQPLYQSGGTFLLEIRPTSAAVSSSNPRGSMIARLYSYSGISGKVGDASMFSADFQNADNGITWGTI